MLLAVFVVPIWNAQYRKWPVLHTVYRRLSDFHDVQLGVLQVGSMAPPMLTGPKTPDDGIRAQTSYRDNPVGLSPMSCGARYVPAADVL